MKAVIGKILKTVLPLGFGIYLLWYFFTNMSDESIVHFKTAFREADYFYIALSMFLGWVALVSRAIRWGYVLEPIGHKTSMWHRYHAINIGYLMNLTIPRSGEASRAAVLYRSDKVPFGKSFGTIVVERMVDLVALGIITLIAFYLGGEDFAYLWDELIAKFGGQKTSNDEGSPWLWIVIGLVLLGGILVLLKAKKDEAFREKIVGFVKGIISGVFAIFKSKSPAGYVFHTVLIWTSYVLMFLIPLYALDSTVDVPIRGVFIGFFVGTLGIIFTNGGIGTYPLLVGMVISFYLTDENPQDAEGIGNALGMLIWTAQTLVVVVFGLISMFMIPKKHGKEDVDIQKDSEQGTSA